jgi:hypothetical protein
MAYVLLLACHRHINLRGKEHGPIDGRRLSSAAAATAAATLYREVSAERLRTYLKRPPAPR